ncbi:hypothetical protein [Pyrodictium delaneyi]|nr:hypothetical protein [Pyrodictium delaneyi]
MKHARLRGISYLIAAIALTVVSLVAAYGVYSWMQGQVSAYTRGSLDVSIKPVVTDTTTYLVITIRNTGGSSITIQQAYLDSTTDITASLGLPQTLEPGSVYQKVVDVGSLSGGKHTVKLVYSEGGDTKEDIWDFVV